MTGDTRSFIVDYVRDHPGQRPAQVADDTGLSREAVKKMLQRLVAAGTLRTDGRGRYHAGGRRHLSLIPATGESGDSLSG